MKCIFNYLAPLIFIVLSASSCKSEKDCPDDIMCTMMFVSISVDIENADGEAVVLTKARVSSEFLNEPLNPLEEFLPGGSYAVLSDSHLQFLDHRNSRPFLFEGWINDSLVVSEQYMIRHDCCHVVRESGPEKIMLD